MEIRIGIGGMRGRMGQTIVQIARESGEFELVGGVVRDARAIGSCAGSDFLVSSNVGEFLNRIDMFIDFSTAEAMSGHLDAMVEGNLPYLSGVTGLSDPQMEGLRAASNLIPVFHSANFSIGVAVIAELVSLAAAWMPEADVEIVDLHHRRKRDAPSGTAQTLVDAIEAGRPGSAGRRVMGRTGAGQRAAGEIGVHSLRGGGNAGEHQVLLASESEEVWIGHRALDRTTFAEGALQAAKWLANQPPGLYGMKDLVAGRIDA